MYFKLQLLFFKMFSSSHYIIEIKNSIVFYSFIHGLHLIHTWKADVLDPACTHFSAIYFEEKCISSFLFSIRPTTSISPNFHFVDIYYSIVTRETSSNHCHQLLFLLSGRATCRPIRSVESRCSRESVKNTLASLSSITTPELTSTTRTRTDRLSHYLRFHSI